MKTTLAGMIVVLASLGVARGGEEANQCIACHQREVLPISLGHSFDDWRGSAHGRGGVGCERCHGGDSGATDAALAHKAVLPTTDPESLVNPRHLAATCGGCHQKQLGAYAGTVHAHEVKAQGRGATCSTCHGAMATSLPSPNELSARCGVCHKKPLQVQAALGVLATAKSQLRRTRLAMDSARTSNAAWYATGADRFHALERSYDDIQLEWHQFRMTDVLRESLDVLKLAKSLAEEAGIMARHPAP